MDTKLYVGNLAYATTESEIRHLFAQAGKVIAVDLIKDQASGQSKGFAFVTMSTPAEAQAAIGRFHQQALAGRALTVNPAQKREAPAGQPQSRFSAFGAGVSGPGRKPAGRKPGGPVVGGYQSRYSAFGDRNDAPPQPRRRGGTPRH